jgi:hypothetical protein
VERQIGGKRGEEAMRESSPGHHQPETDRSDETKTTRRRALRLAGGGASLAALATVRFGGHAHAQDATPIAGATKEGAHAVFRTRIVKPDKSIDDLTATVRAGLVPIIKQIPGYIDYYIVQNFDTRERTGVAIFADKTGADESTAKASEFLRSEGLTDYYENVDPVIVEGEIVIATD